MFVTFLKKVAEKYALKAIHCFMPDHVHLILLGNSDNTDLLRAVGDYKQMTGHWLGKHRPGVHWQKGFCDRILRMREMPVQIAYVLDNPVRRGLVDDWREYPFTGAVGLDLEDFLRGMQ